MSYILIVAGATMLAAGALWRTAKRVQTRRSVRRALTHGSPAVRRNAIEALGVQGIGPYASDLRELVAWEEDPAVIDALAEAVNRSQWESSVSRDLFSLRMWAAGRRSAPPQPEQHQARSETPPRPLHLFRRESEAIELPLTDACDERAEVVTVDELKARRERWA